MDLGVLFCNYCQLFRLILHLSYSVPELNLSFCSNRNCLLLCGADQIFPLFFMLFFDTSLNLVGGSELLQCWEVFSIKVKKKKKRKSHEDACEPFREHVNIMLKQLSNVIRRTVLPC